MRSPPAARSFVAEELQGAAEIGLDQTVARRRHLATRHPDRHVLGPVAELVGVLAHVIEHDLVPGEAPPTRSAPRARHVAKRHRAPALQRLDAGVRRSRHDSTPDAQRDRAAVAFDEGVGIERLRPAADASDGHDLAGLREAEDHRARHRRRSPGRCRPQPRVRIAATPASIALPPFSSASNARAERRVFASSWPVLTRW